MFKRLILLFVLVPSLALAADGDQLGPSTANDPNQGPSQNVSQYLQPASPTTSQSLQSADAIEGGVPQASANNNLQSAGDKSQFDNFVGAVGDSPQQKLPDSSSNSRPWWTAGIALGVALLVWLQEQFKPFAKQ
ncbi:MAG TPA: hypothetical protein VLF41_03705 [Candidatus Nanoarchaeia archaeon]|nr:hypothetical protein [Candidatus Nanoarchaeia archaeon]